jgi:hypothetical protein
MSLRKFINCLSLLLCFSIYASAQDRRDGRASQSKQSDAFQYAKVVTTRSTTSYEFAMSGFTYHISDNGNGWRKKGDATRRFNLGLPGPYPVSVMYYAEYQGNVLLVGGITDGDMFQQGFVTRLEQPSMRSRWKQTIPGLLGGEPLRVKQYLYVTGRRFIGKLDLTTGDYIWKHDKLDERSDKGNFMQFVRPEVDGDEVLFKEADVYNRRAATVVVNNKTGKIVRFE